MSSRILLLWVIVLCLWGCSKDSQDTGPNDISTIDIPDFKVLGSDLENIYQYNYTTDSISSETVNLTTDNAINNQFLTLRQVGDILTFYNFAFGNFTAIQRNVATGEYRVLDNIYSVEDESSVIWGTNSGEKVFFGYYSPRGSSNYGIRSIDIASRASMDISIEDNVQTVYEPLYHNGKLFITYRDLNGNIVVDIINADTFELIRTWDFGSSTASIFIEAAGDIAVITNLAGNEYLNTIYDFDTLEAISETSFNLERFFQPGPIDVELVADRLYYLYLEPVPSSVPYSPAIYDFIQDQNIILELFEIVQQVEQESGRNVSFTSYRYLPEGRVFLFGYTVDFNGGSFDGGILLISEQGELIEHRITPFIPIYFLK